MAISFITDEYKVTINLPENDRDILKGILTIQRDAASYLLNVANDDLDNRMETQLTQFDYNGDHVDYNTAASLILTMITNELCGDGDFADAFRPGFLELFNLTPTSEQGLHYRSPRSILAKLLSDDEFITSLDTWGGYSTDMIQISYADDAD